MFLNKRKQNITQLTTEYKFGNQRAKRLLIKNSLPNVTK